MQIKIFKSLSRLLLIFCMVFLLAPYAVSTPISFDLQIANPSVAIFRLENTSGPGTEITGLSLFIGDTDYNFDKVGSFFNIIDTGSILTPSLITGDDDQGGVNDPAGRFDTIALAFSGFDSGDRFEFSTDIDEDNNNTDEDFLTILFNNGASVENAWISVSFLAGLEKGTINYTLPDMAIEADQRYDFESSGKTDPIPEPATLMLFGLGILGLTGMNRRKKQ
jgi:hypothetical protein